MPFAGDTAAAAVALRALRGLRTQPGDELILADNSIVAVAADGVTVVRATAERSPAYARNAGAQHATNDWILFLDADCLGPSDLLDVYFARDVEPRVGALAGEVAPATGADTLAERYGAARSFLSQEAHLAHPYRPRAVAANLLVRRVAFEQVGGFYEGVRAAEDTDFSWRLQQAGWRLELRSGARVEHRYRPTVRELRRQWRGYAAGRAWLQRRYEGFEPQSAARRAWNRVRHGSRPLPAAISSPEARPWRRAVGTAGRLERGRYLMLDAVLAAEELAGLRLSNRPIRDRGLRPRATVRVVLVADRFPARDDPLAAFARTLGGARVEAAARPDVVDGATMRALSVDYREDDGVAVRAVAAARLMVRHPWRCALDVVRRGSREPKLASLAPAVLRLERDQGARVHPLGGEHAHAAARRLAALAGRRLDP
jgi:GT2 family glycosyltransferase